MSMRGFMRAIRHWWVAARHGVGGDMFGWGTLAAAVILGCAHQQYGFTVSEQASWWFMPLASAFAALVVVAAFNALALAPYRAWRMLKPFQINVVCGQLDAEYPKEAFPRQSAAVVIKNLSYRQRSNCVLHVLQITGFDNQQHALPRFISEFSLLPGDRQQIKFLSWTTRSPPHENDQTFMLSGPVGWGWDGNVVTLLCGSCDIDIRIGVPEADAIVLHCRVWADGNDLRAVLRAD
jgi:hypothetical protein